MADANTTDALEARLSLREAELVVMVAGAVQLVLGCGAILFSQWVRSPAAFCEGWHLLLGVGLWALILFHQRLRRLAIEEEREVAELARAGTPEQGANLFESEGIDPFSARNRLAKFERFMVPSLTGAGAAALAGSAWLMYRRLGQEAGADAGRHLPALALFWGMALVCLLFGRYASGMARRAPWRPLRAGGDYMVSNAIGCFLVGAAHGVVQYFKLPVADVILGWAVLGFMVVLALETGVNLVLDFYRPRVPGQEVRFAYDSRILGLLTEPAGIMRTAAATLDYQFGFRVSETWFYKFMERAIAPLILFQLLTFYLLTCVVIVGPHEEAIIERMGRYRGHPCGPGIYLKLPWPMATVYRYPAGLVQTVEIGGEAESEEPEGHDHEHDHAQGRGHGGGDIIWAAAKGHTHIPYMVAAKRTAESAAGESQTIPVSYLEGTFSIQYRIRDLEKYHYSAGDAPAVFQVAARREILRYLTSVDFGRFLAQDRLSAGQELKGRIQRAADALGLGIEVVFVSLHDLHPPGEVAESFEDVIAAEIERLALVGEAEAYKMRLKPLAEQEAAATLARAEADKFRRVEVGRQEAWRFGQQIRAYEAAGEVFIYREYLRTLRTVLQDARKILVPAGSAARRIISINVEEKGTADMGDFIPPDTKEIR